MEEMMVKSIRVHRKAERGIVACPHCGCVNPVVKRDPTDDWLQRINGFGGLRIDGAPVGMEKEWLETAYDFCPECGLASEDLLVDSLIDLDLFSQAKRSIRRTLSDHKIGDVEKSLILGVCRFGYSPSAWQKLFRFYWTEGKEKDATAILGMIKQFYKHEINGVLQGYPLTLSDACDILFVADDMRKCKKFKQATRLVEGLLRSRIFGGSPAESQALLPMKVLLAEKELCSNEDSTTDL